MFCAYLMHYSKYAIEILKYFEHFKYALSLSIFSSLYERGEIIVGYSFFIGRKNISQNLL